MPLQTTVRFYGPSGTPRQPRGGMMTVVRERRKGSGLVVVGQNKNAVLGKPPELQEIKTPLPIPGAGEKP
jgi:hypothetical protein